MINQTVHVFKIHSIKNYRDKTQRMQCKTNHMAIVRRFSSCALDWYSTGWWSFLCQPYIYKQVIRRKIIYNYYWFSTIIYYYTVFQVSVRVPILCDLETIIKNSKLNTKVPVIHISSVLKPKLSIMCIKVRPYLPLLLWIQNVDQQKVDRF